MSKLFNINGNYVMSESFQKAVVKWQNFKMEKHNDSQMSRQISYLREDWEQPHTVILLCEEDEIIK